jgi:hypothetical protein
VTCVEKVGFEHLSSRLSLLAFVPLNDAALPGPDRLLEFAKSTYPEEFGDASGELNGDLMTLECLGQTLFIVLMPMPLPRSRLWESPSWRWPTVAEDVKGHKHHAIVGIVRDECSPVVRSALLTMLVASLLSSTDSIGVCWGSALAVNSRDFFIEQAKGLAAGKIPLPLWVDVYGKRRFFGRKNLRTVGMNDFGLMEIEVRGTRQSARHMFGVVFDMADYLLKKGPVIKDGDTIGNDDGFLRVSIVSSSWDKNENVYLLHV